MEAVFAALLHVSDPARNLRRAYRIEAGRDLFGTWLVEVTFGRIGARDRTRTFVAGDEVDALRHRAALPLSPTVRAPAHRRGLQAARAQGD